MSDVKTTVITSSIDGGAAGSPADVDQRGKRAPADGELSTREEMREDLGNAFDFAIARNPDSGRPVAFYCLADGEPLGNPSVREIGKGVVDWAAERAAGRHLDMQDVRVPEVDLVIDSVGGDIHAAYRLVSLLYDKTDIFNACVPTYARSAATLLCVAADRLVLDDLAVLGPLDAQVYEAGRNYRPALNTFKSLERITDFSLDTLRKANDTIEALNLTSEQAIKYAMQFVRTMSESMFAPMEATKIGEYSQALAVGERYGDRLYGRRPRGRLGIDDWRAMIKKLVNDYPSHEVVIDRAELDKLGLRVDSFGSAERPFVRRIAERKGMQRMVFFLDPTRYPNREAWLNSRAVDQLMRAEAERRAKEGAHRAAKRPSVYEVSPYRDVAAPPSNAANPTTDGR